MDDSELELDEYTDIKSLTTDFELNKVNLNPPDIYKITNTVNISFPPSYFIEEKSMKYKYEDLTDHTLFYLFYESYDALINKYYGEDIDIESKLIERRNMSMQYLNRLGYKYHTKLNYFIFILGDINPDNKKKEFLVFDRIKWKKVNLYLKIDSDFIKGLK